MDDRSILFELYDATGGSSWTTSSGWRSDNMPFCDWHGVTCQVVDGKPHVTELDLSSNNLNGIVPSVVFHLPELRKLDVRNNPVSVTFLGVEAASNLEELYLDETLVNSLDGVGKAPNLKVLHVYKNSFGWKSIPDELFDVTTLTDLNLSDSMFGGKLSGKVGPNKFGTLDTRRKCFER
jgi:Leucine-rich repeat (LRR) protein